MCETQGHKRGGFYYYQGLLDLDQIVTKNMPLQSQYGQ
jgi:hypothetical protein